MARRRTAQVTVESRVIVVSGWQVSKLLTGAGMRPIYAGTRQGWLLDRHRLPDVLAALQHHGVDYTVMEDDAA